MISYKFEAYAITGIIILISGLLRIYLYYQLFHFSVLPFLDSGEITTLFFDSLLFFLVFLLVNSFVVLMFYRKQFLNNDEASKVGIITRIKSYGLFHYSKIICVVFCSIILLIINSQFNKIYFYEFWLWLILLFIAFYFNPFILFEGKQYFLKIGKQVSRISLIFLLTAINLITISGCFAINEAHKVKSYDYYLNTEFEIIGKPEIKSTKDFYYIGKTRQYVFFYDQSNKESIIIPISNISQFKFHNN